MGYRIKAYESGFALFYNREELCKFTRETFRQDLERYAQHSGRSSQWIGFVLRIFNKQYPLSVKYQPRPLVERFRLDDLADYMRCKGYAVYKQLHSQIDDIVVISHLEKHGFIVEGLGYFSFTKSITLN